MWLTVLAGLLLGQHSSLAQEVRFALVIGNDQYRTATLATPANDAGLVADALGGAGFAVTGARNLDQAALRETFRELSVKSRRPRQMQRGNPHFRRRIQAPRRRRR
jgi:Caspase domain